ncbi:hypothetical protein PNEG_02617 [Pneumocystis murina B123]|uniref:FHA domain-containing protein n=1 Tax=Pneumocystis murina (strain B123) TaxID=1069680 RepID=M7P4S9_PNEMU|nr:hypothetical protein PNEG_02617 [Pneumocystis murina B123]EMR08830.1 hypothetical protein PNEG_02617 [Pneumocystis murina B123]
MEIEILDEELSKKFSKEKTQNLSSSPLYYLQNSDEKNPYLTPDLSSCADLYPSLSPQYTYDSFNNFPFLRLDESKAVYIGRSSQSCNLSISKKNMFISRIHAKLEYHSENKAVYVTCLGWNGMLLHIQTEHGPRKIRKGETSVVEWVPNVGSIIVEIAGSYSRVLWPTSLELSIDNKTRIDEINSPYTNNENVQPFSQKIYRNLGFYKNKPERSPLKRLTYQDFENTRIYDSSIFPNSNYFPLSASLDNSDTYVNHSSDNPYSTFLSTDKAKINTNNSLSVDIKNFGPEPDSIDSSLLDSVLTTLAFSPLSAVPLSTLTCLFPSTFLKEDVEKWLRNAGQFIAEIKREGKDASGKPLENQWYYVPEKDDNEERKASLLPFIRPIRQSRKIHKQYYWKKPRLPTSNNITALTFVKKKKKISRLT